MAGASPGEISLSLFPPVPARLLSPHHHVGGNGSLMDMFLLE